MPHDTSLIATIVIGLVLAFILGAIANRLKVSALVGYLLAGVLVGPFTPGFVADQTLAPQLAEIGVILLMFGVGLHFSLKELLSVWSIAVPGAIVQISFATLLGVGLSELMGWPLTGGIVFGLALSVASTVVLLRALQERRLVETERGRITVGWLIVEDLVMVLALVLLPVFADFLVSDPEEAQGAGEIVLNSIDADGMKTGYDIEITRRISDSVGVPVVASGGAGKLEHMVEVLLDGKADAVLAASIFHFGEYTVDEVKAFLAKHGVPVRPIPNLD